MKKYIELENFVAKEKIRYNEEMKNHTTVKVGGPCKCMVIPENIDDIISTIKFAKKEGIDYYIIGCGSNLLVCDEGIDAIVIKLGNKFAKVEVKDDVIEAQSGASMPYIAVVAKNHFLSGMEFASGIPGTIGGGVRMNAGAYGGEISNIFLEATYLDADGNIKCIKKEDMKFSYRHSFFTDNKEFIILSIKLKLQHGNIDDIAKIMEKNSIARKEKQPLEYPNFGSVFKRPEGHFVGKLVQDTGLRGYKIGGAQVSTKHTGFIVNIGGATCKDIVNLIHHIQNVVFEKYNVKLETEVVFIGGKI